VDSYGDFLEFFYFKKETRQLKRTQLNKTTITTLQFNQVYMFSKHVYQVGI